MDSFRLACGDKVDIAADFGCNLFSWVVGGKDTFYTPHDFMNSVKHFYHGGNPILFPSVGRTWDFSSTEPLQDIYQINGNNGKHSMPIHGILTLTEWTQYECVETHAAIRVAYKLHIPGVVRELSYPFDMAVFQTYEIEPNIIKMTTRIINKGDKSAPFAFGYHPYFALSGTDRKGVTLSLPSTTRLELDPNLLVPTDRTEQTDSDFQLESGRDYDCVYGNLTGTRATIGDAQSGRMVHIDFDKSIENLVIYAGAGTPAVCVEPWTKGLGAFSKLSEAGWEHGDAINVLEPGQEHVLQVKYTVEHMQ